MRNVDQEFSLKIEQRPDPLFLTLRQVAAQRGASVHLVADEFRQLLATKAVEKVPGQLRYSARDAWAVDRWLLDLDVELATEGISDLWPASTDAPYPCLRLSPAALGSPTSDVTVAWLPLSVFGSRVSAEEFGFEVSYRRNVTADLPLNRQLEAGLAPHEVYLWPHGKMGSAVAPLQVLDFGDDHPETWLAPARRTGMMAFMLTARPWESYRSSQMAALNAMVSIIPARSM